MVTGYRMLFMRYVIVIMWNIVKTITFKLYNEMKIRKLYVKSIIKHKHMHMIACYVVYNVFI